MPENLVGELQSMVKVAGESWKTTKGSLNHVVEKIVVLGSCFIILGVIGNYSVPYLLVQMCKIHWFFFVF